MNLSIAFKFIEYASLVVKYFSALILLVGFIKGLIFYISMEFNKASLNNIINSTQNIRSVVGSYILLGLDFYIISDLLDSMLTHEINDLVELAIIVAMRTTIGFFLGKEIITQKNK